ncbi:MAG TPA: cyclic nucleotide-binding domain-containing protein, partial [Gemmatimonadaceae bacterium]|nr:cyclic nucleotide-binding domain-containing protein [Gemmatimonadaceae bacterium]
MNREVHFVVSGLLRATADSGIGKRIFFRDIPAGDIFGESTAIDGQAHFADVMCAREALVASMSIESFRALIANYASVRERVLRRLTHSVRDLAERMLDLRTMSVA